VNTSYFLSYFLSVGGLVSNIPGNWNTKCVGN
jgi:hypothetical protein